MSHTIKVTPKSAMKEITTSNGKANVDDRAKIDAGIADATKSAGNALNRLSQAFAKQYAMRPDMEPGRALKLGTAHALATLVYAVDDTAVRLYALNSIVLDGNEHGDFNAYVRLGGQEYRITRTVGKVPASDEHGAPLVDGDRGTRADMRVTAPGFTALDIDGRVSGRNVQPYETAKETLSDALRDAVLNAGRTGRIVADTARVTAKESESAKPARKNKGTDDALAALIARDAARDAEVAQMRSEQAKRDAETAKQQTEMLAMLAELRAGKELVTAKN